MAKHGKQASARVGSVRAQPTGKGQVRAKPNASRMKRPAAAPARLSAAQMASPSPSDALDCIAPGAPRGRDNVRVASDCSGWCTEVMAATDASMIPVVHVFACDNNRNIRKFISTFHAPCKIFSDIVSRTMDQTPGDLDCYVGGFPCQPFSMAGLMLGLEDPAGRGQIIFHLLNYIAEKTPVTFILENVPGLAQMFPDTLAAIIQYLRELRTAGGDLKYEVHWTVLDTSVHGGLPQHRPRLYIVGVLRKNMCEPFDWPAPSTRIRNLSEVLKGDVGSLDDIDSLPETKRVNVMTGMMKIAEMAHDPTTTEAIINIGGTKPEFMIQRCPCLTKNRCADSAFYSTKRLRVLSIEEMMALQGVNAEVFAGWDDVLSARMMGGIVGNAMSKSVLQRVMIKLFRSVGIPVCDDSEWS